MPTTWLPMKAIFIELSSFSARRSDYLTDDEFRKFQDVLMKSPKAGNVIAGTGGLRKIRIADSRRGKGKRGGLRTIYYWPDDEATFDFTPISSGISGYTWDFPTLVKGVPTRCLGIFDNNLQAGKTRRS